MDSTETLRRTAMELAKQRQAAGVPQIELAKRLGLHVGQLNKIERGVRTSPVTDEFAARYMETLRAVVREHAQAVSLLPQTPVKNT